MIFEPRIIGLVLTSEMEVIVTTRQHTNTPFHNGAYEIREAYMRPYGFDYKKARCSVNDFESETLE